jgi:hypothetical protein
MFYSTIYFNICNQIFIHYPVIGYPSMDVCGDVIQTRQIQRQINLSKTTKLTLLQYENMAYFNEFRLLK